LEQDSEKTSVQTTSRIHVCALKKSKRVTSVKKQIAKFGLIKEDFGVVTT